MTASLYQEVGELLVGWYLDFLLFGWWAMGYYGCSAGDGLPRSGSVHWRTAPRIAEFRGAPFREALSKADRRIFTTSCLQPGRRFDEVARHRFEPGDQLGLPRPPAAHQQGHPA